MKIIRIIFLSFHAIRENPFRSFLTVLGVVIGVFLVITTVSMAEGAKQFIYEQITSLGFGANTLGIYGAPETERRGFGVMAAMMKSSIT
ncbi:MAG: ABC transporter permease, partial [Candidatus Margulisiibacteriota bacterium]